MPKPRFGNRVPDEIQAQCDLGLCRKTETVTARVGKWTSLITERLLCVGTTVNYRVLKRMNPDSQCLRLLS